MPCTKPVKPFNPASSAPDFYYPAFGKRSVEHTHAFLKVGLEFPFNEYRAGWQMGGQPLVMRPGDKHHSWQALQSLVPLDRVAYFEKM